MDPQQQSTGADNEEQSQTTKMILKQKLVSLKVCHESIKFRKNFITIRLGNMNNVRAVVDEFCKMRGIPHPELYRLLLHDHILVNDKSLQENQIDTTSQLFFVTLIHESEAVKYAYPEQRLVKRKEKMVPAKIYVPPPTPVGPTSSNNAASTTGANSSTSGATTGTDGEKKKKPKNVDVKLRIQEKVNNQVIGCDITAKSGMKFEKIQAMYCNHRKYNIKDYVFASYGVLMEPTKTLNQLGLNQPGKVYTIQVYNKDRVNIADSPSTPQN